MKSLLWVWVLLLVMPLMAFGQDRDIRERIEEERRQSFEEFHQLQNVLDEGFFWDYGGWIRCSLFNYDDGTNVDRTLRDFDLRSYYDFRYDTIHRLYIRTKSQYTDYNTGDASDGNDNDLNGPKLDQGWYRLDLDQLLDKTGGWQGAIIVGRQFLMLGDGFIFNMTNDGISFDFKNSMVGLQASVSKTIRSGSDFDQSRPKAEDSKRSFFSGQFSWLGFDKHRPFAYVLIQRDNNNGDDWTPLQDYDYNSQHYGFGMGGEIIRNLRYHFEYAAQRGDSTANGSTRSEDIRAWGFEGKLDYTWSDLWWQPRVNTAYLTGSGDRDRRSITNTVFGNQLGTTDRNFIEFGYTDTGLSLAPRTANMHIFNVGGVAKPLSKWDYFKDFEIGTQLFFYRKRIGDSVMSDGFATRQDKEVGWEWDVYSNWRIFSDLSMSAQYGLFQPGDAYPNSNDNSRHFFAMSFTFTY
ncbi:alginate export family protein [Planctomycetota bacterium]